MIQIDQTYEQYDNLIYKYNQSITPELVFAKNVDPYVSPL